MARELTRGEIAERLAAIPARIVEDVRAAGFDAELIGGEVVVHASHVLDPADLDACVVCGCTDEEACDGGCTWIAPGLCSQCPETAVEGFRVLKALGLQVPS